MDECSFIKLKTTFRNGESMIWIVMLIKHYRLRTLIFRRELPMVDFSFQIIRKVHVYQHNRSYFLHILVKIS